MPQELNSEPSVENTIPVLGVSDLQASIRFYREVLGFKLDWGGEDASSHIASVSRDGHCIMLQRTDRKTSSCVWIGGSILVPLWEKIRLMSDIAIVRRPTNQRWALEMQIKDPDGNILWFGTDPLKDVPDGQEAPDEKLLR